MQRSTKLTTNTCGGFLFLKLAPNREYMETQLKLKVKGNYQVFPVEARGIDVLGYVFFHEYTLLRKSIKQRFARMLRRNRNWQSYSAYMGWLKHCNSKNLLKKLIYDTNQNIQGLINQAA